MRSKEDAAQAATIFERAPMGRNEKQQQAKRVRDMRTVSQMIALYCAGNHDRAARTETAFCGKPVCPACAQLDAYAHLRTEKCPFMETKVSCDRCNVHCYTPQQLEQIRTVMRYSGPRLMLYHPVAAIRHLAGI